MAKGAVQFFRRFSRKVASKTICMVKAAMPPRDPERKIVLAITAAAESANALLRPLIPPIKEITNGIGSQHFHQSGVVVWFT